MRVPPVPLHPVITVGPFSKWGIDFMTCNPCSVSGHAYIIVVINYFMKWADMMPTVAADGNTTTQFIFNHVITRFGAP